MHAVNRTNPVLAGNYAPIEDATAAFWAAVHGVTSLLINEFWSPEMPAIALVRDAMTDQLTMPKRPAPRRTKGTSK